MFNANTFDTSLGIDDTIIYDLNGTIDANGHFGGQPELYGYVPQITLGYIFDILDGSGHDIDASDLWATYNGSTYHNGINSAFSSGGVVTYYIDNGIQGTAGSDVILDISGDNIVDAGDGNDLVVVGIGDDAVAGGDGNDEIYTGWGNDIVDAGSGSDRVFLWNGDDLARGGRGADEIYGQDGNDKIWGQQGHDYLSGGAGNDKLVGGGGRDQLFGDDGNDVLKGGAGADTLSGGIGADILTGGRGKDTFIFDLSDGSDTITDFDPAKDKIELDLDLGLSSYNDVLGVSAQVGNDVVIDFGNGDVLTLEDTQISSLTVDDFAFI